ncbi:MBL fold metallo-hydrolase [Saccharopolyspora hordei]|uniref:L-ascorbate metabolism protein UlaG (Beta-lactamase superfamily) n=1 Tax=Saccharopolyspora hordei TaxID=1838 RepID=A0A853AEK0_9PSEU|nr:L-ascorbate metabolism protein UlaG (beta-lactamase superfamily) [Saccharopolyspora hordei]
MQITHFGHSCVLVETGSARLLIDPGTFSSDFEGLRDLDAVLITHQHPDHLDLDRLPALLEANPGARLVVDPGSAGPVESKGLEATTARAGDALELGGTSVTVVGGRHAVIHPDIPVVDNIGYLVEGGAFYHPGDSFFVPDQRVDVLGLPTGAPWLKLSEAVDFLRAVAPRTAVPIHEAVLARPQMHYRMFEQLKPERTTVHVLTRGTAAEV